MSKPSVAILGLGIMGSGMAGRLLSANFPFTVYNRNREKCLPFTGTEAFVAGSPRPFGADASAVPESPRSARQRPAPESADAGADDPTALRTA